MRTGSSTRTIRLLHRYLGLFFSPAIVFFAFTGALQTFSWHESSRGGAYEPPAWIVRMAQIHKKQTLSVPPAKIRPPVKRSAAPAEDAKRPRAESLGQFALKCFVFVMALGLMLTTTLGVIMALRYGGDARLVWTLLALGTVFPVALVLL